MRDNELDKELYACCESVTPGTVHLFCMPAACGKTTFVREFIAQHMETSAVICASRQKASDFKERLWKSVLKATRDDSANTTYLTKPNVFTTASLAFYLLQNATLSEVGPEDVGEDDEKSFSLITGAQQMNLIDECIDDYLESAALQTDSKAKEQAQAHETASKALKVSTFKQELREFFEMMQDHGFKSADIQSIASSEDLPLLSIAAVLLDDYLGRLEGRIDGARSYDHISLLNQAKESLNAKENGNDSFDAEYLFVDDAQDLSLSGLKLLEQLSKNFGTKVILLFNEYLTSNGFRGSLGASLYKHVKKENTHFFASYTPRTALQSMITEKAASLEDGVQVLEVSSTLEQTLYVANQIRQSYLSELEVRAMDRSSNFDSEHDLPVDSALALPKYNQYAIIAHSSSSFAEIAYGLRSQNIPVQGVINSKALREEPLWLSFESFLKLALSQGDAQSDVQGDTQSNLPPSLVRNASLSLLESLRKHYGTKNASTKNNATQSGQNSDLETFAKDLAKMIESNAPMPSVLWSIWERSNAGSALQNEAIKSVQPDFANHHLDVSLQIFSLAERYYLEHTDLHNDQHENQHKNTSTKVLIKEFIGYIESLPVAVDNIHATKSADAVQLLTPANASGMHFKQVFCIDFNESSWPNTRLRDSILYTSVIPHVLVARASGEPMPISAFTEPMRRLANLHNELCLFYVSLTRGERVHFITVESEESTASPFLKLLPKARSISGVSYPALTLNDMQKQLRFKALEQALLGKKTLQALEESQPVQNLAKMLVLDTGVESLQSWQYADHMPSQEEAFGEDESVFLGPSSLETLLECPMQWFLKQAGGAPAQSGQSAMEGTVVHKVLQTLPQLVGGSREENIQEMHKVFDNLQQGKVMLSEGERAEDYILNYDTDFDAQMSKIRINRCFENAAGYYEYIADRSNISSYRTIQYTEFRPDDKVEIAPGVKLSGVIDRVEIGEDYKQFVMDWKTSGTLWKPSENVPLNMQLLAYQKLLDPEDTGKTSGGALVFLGKDAKDVSGMCHTQESVAKIRDEVKELFKKAANNARGNKYTASLNTKCNYCDLKTSCPLQEEGGTL